MFLVKDRRFGMDNFLFIQLDPRQDGYTGEVIEDAKLDYDMPDVRRWPDGEPHPDPQLGRDPKDPTRFKVFKFPQELKAAGFDFVHSHAPLVAYSWSDYRRQYRPEPEEVAEKMTRDEWFDELEWSDRTTKIRSQMADDPEPDARSSRDEVAKWVARRHMGADGGVQQVWYLPGGAPADEIRLLEAGDRYGGFEPIKPIDFGLDIDGKAYKLLVADVTTGQLEKVKNGLTQLPSGWADDSAVVWGRRP